MCVQRKRWFSQFNAFKVFENVVLIVFSICSKFGFLVVDLKMQKSSSGMPPHTAGNPCRFLITSNVSKSRLQSRSTVCRLRLIEFRRCNENVIKPQKVTSMDKRVDKNLFHRSLLHLPTHAFLIS